MTNQDKLEALKQTCENCKNCELHTVRTNIVFGEGALNPQILIIGEAPGENEDLQSKPFVGRSGKLLDKLLNEQGFDRKTNVYILNMIKCRPPKNRDPKPDELRCCSTYLKQQIELINPQVILCLGRISSTKLIDPNFKVTLQHGQVFLPKDCVASTLGGLSPSSQIIGTFHPAALLRNPNNVPLFKEDLRKVKELLNDK